MDNAYKKWSAADPFARWSDRDFQTLLRRVRADAADRRRADAADRRRSDASNQLSNSHDSKHGEEGSTEAYARATQHERDAVHFPQMEQHDKVIATNCTFAEKEPPPPAEFSIQCWQFVNSTAVQEGHIKSLIRRFSSDLNIIIDLLQQWQSVPSAASISMALTPLLDTADAYAIAVQALKQSEVEDKAWWSTRRPKGMTASQISDAIVGDYWNELRRGWHFGDALMWEHGDHPGKGHCSVSSSVSTGLVGCRTAWKVVETQRTGLELQPILQGMGRMLRIWAREEDEDGLRSALMHDFETRCGRSV
jgi:hypothetical protein